jgi:hypothetical protein
MRHLSGLWLCLALAAVSASPAGAESSTLSGVSRNLNPAISVNGLVRGHLSSLDDSADLNGFRLDGVETQFTAVVDPYWKANVQIGIHPEHGHEEGEDAHGVTYAAHVEGAYLDSQALPAGWALRAGRFRLPFGKHKPLHMHQFPFADSPVGLDAFLGDHALIENGLQVSHGLPVPWFSDLTGYAVGGDADVFDAGHRDPAWGARLVNMWDVSQDATVELSGSYLHGVDGRHPGEGAAVGFLGADLTYKWVSSARTGGPALTLTGEVLLPDYEEGPTDPRGWYALAQYRFKRHWWLGVGLGQARALHEEEEEATDEEAHDHGFEGEAWEYKINLTYAPSEFSFVRAEAGYHEDRVTGEHDWRGIVQVNFTIGSHPAHLY